MKLNRIVILAILLTAIILPAFAQSNRTWFVYLFDNVNNEIIRVYDTGEMEVYSLGLEANEYAHGVNINGAISPDGSLLAYCKMTVGETEFSGYTLIVRDITNATNLLEEPISADYQGCQASGFNADGSQFVLGLPGTINFNPDTGQAVAGTDPLWRIQIIETQTGNVLSELNSNHPAAPSVDVFGRVQPVPLMADAIIFENDVLVFRGIPFVGMEIPGELPAWSWNLTTDTVEPVANFGRVSSDYLPQTGEFVYPAMDETRPFTNAGVMLSDANVVNLQLSDGTIQTVYHNAEEIVVNVRFVNNGQAIGVSLLKGFDPNNPVDIFPVRHIIVDRSGNVTEVGESYEQYTQLISVPDSAVIAWSEWPDGAAPITHLSIVEAGTLREIWQYTPDTSRGYGSLELLWSPAIEIQDDLQPFTPIQN